MTAPSGPPEAPWSGPTPHWGPGPQPGPAPGPAGWAPVAGFRPGPAPDPPWGQAPVRPPRRGLGADTAATALSYLSGVLCAWSAMMLWAVLLFTQILVNQFASVSPLPASSGGFDDSTLVPLALGTLVLLVLGGLCFVGAGQFSRLGASGLAVAGNIGVVLVLLLGAVTSGGGGWVLLLAPVPLGALIAVLMARSAPAGSGR